jgi:CubicO group peptidase (beta-lactamase class C family)
MPASDLHAMSASMAQHLEALRQAQDFSGAALVARGEETVFEAAVGAADLGRNDAVAVDTLFRIGSVTKPITAAAVFRLQDERLLSAADAIGRHLSNVPASWSAITIAQLLTHTSGIASYTNLPEYSALEQLPAAPREILARVAEVPLLFEPGRGYAYSNTNYVLLGLLLENASGEPYETVLKNRIFSPLRMEHSGYVLPPHFAARLARGYDRADGTWKLARKVDMSVAYAAGGLYSTVQDLARFADGLFNRGVLTSSSLDAMVAPAHRHCASGWFVGEHHGLRMMWHSGAIAGYSSHLAYFPDQRVTIAVLTNHESGTADTAALDLASLAFGESCAPPVSFVTVKVDPETLSAYAGEYELPHEQALNVTVDADRLYVQPAGQERFLACAQSRSRFVVREVNADIDFSPDARGTIVLTLRQRGKTYVAPRKTARPV